MKPCVAVFGSKWNIHHVALESGFETIVFNYDPVSNCNQYYFLPKINNNTQTINECVSKIKRPLNGIIVCSEYYVTLASELKTFYFPSLPGIELGQASIVRDKLLLKDFLSKENIRVAPYSKIKSSLEHSLIVPQTGPTFLIKPRKGVLAQDISIIHSEEEFLRWANSHPDVEEYFAEEYLSPIREYCCDTIVANYEIIAQFPGEYTVSCLESNQKHEGIGVNFPGFLPESKLNELKSISRQIIDLLKIRDGFCHIEFLYANDQWYFGEMGCRLPGGYQLPTESYIAGQNLAELYLDIFTQKDFRPTPIDTRGKFYGYYLFPKKVGTVSKITANLNDPWIVESKIHVHEGQVLEHEDSSVTNAAHVVYKATSLDELKTYSDRVRSLIHILYA
jgi:hypothetical protein